MEVAESFEEEIIPQIEEYKQTIPNKEDLEEIIESLSKKHKYLLKLKKAPPVKYLTNILNRIAYTLCMIREFIYLSLALLNRIQPGFKAVFLDVEGNLPLYPAFLKSMIKFQPYHQMQQLKDFVHESLPYLNEIYLSQKKPDTPLDPLLAAFAASLTPSDFADIAISLNDLGMFNTNSDLAEIVFSTLSTLFETRVKTELSNIDQAAAIMKACKQISVSLPEKYKLYNSCKEFILNSTPQLSSYPTDRLVSLFCSMQSHDLSPDFRDQSMAIPSTLIYQMLGELQKRVKTIGKDQFMDVMDQFNRMQIKGVAKQTFLEQMI